MNFFKSVFSDEPEPESNPSNNQPQSDSDPTSPPNPTDAATDGSRWTFGGLIKTLTTKSESVIEIYRRDLKEFGSGIKMEIDVAHGSLETVGHAIDKLGTSVFKGTAQIISQGKEAIMAADDETDSSDNNNDRTITGQQSLNSKPYSRFDAQVCAIQGDASTYCEEPEDLDEYGKWKLGFVLEEKREEVESLIEENGAVESIFKTVVPGSVDEETFWCRYYYRVYKLKQAQDVRANLVKRAISREDEDLSWDVDDDDDDDKKENEDLDEGKEKDKDNEQHEQIVKSDEINKAEAGPDRESEYNVKEEEEEEIAAKDSRGEKGPSQEETVQKADEKVVLEGKVWNGESSKDSDVSVISSHPSMQEEDDLGWDEIEDLSSIDEKKVSHIGSSNKGDLRKRLIAAEEDEDLSWDIEDDDEPVKA